MSRKKVLVTGAAGFVGVNLMRRFALAGAEVFGLVRRAPDPQVEAFLERSAAPATWLLGDVTDRDGSRALVREAKPDVVVHAAAVTFTPEQEKADPATVFDVNAGGTLALLEAARLGGVSRFVLVSTGGLYGKAAPNPALPETTPLRSGSMYAIAKVASEQLCERFAELFGLDVRIGRLGTAYGPMERTTGSRSGLSAIHQLVTAEGDEDGVVRVAGAEIARDFCHIDDVAEAFWQLASGERLSHTVYNVGAPAATDLLGAMAMLAELRPGTRYLPVSNDDVADVRQTAANARGAMDLSRITGDTGWSPTYDLGAGLAAYDRWLGENRDLG